LLTWGKSVTVIAAIREAGLGACAIALGSLDQFLQIVGCGLGVLVWIVIAAAGVAPQVDGVLLD